MNIYVTKTIALRKHAFLCITSLLSACALGIPDYLPPPPKPEPCHVHIKVDGRYKGCVSREHFERIIREQL
jgi:hypothetical protein